VDGVSLTVSGLSERGFAVSLIPETLTRTNLGAIGERAIVNIEVDILAKHVERLLDSARAPVTAGGRS
jgi:riboflavin synthase